MRLQGARAFGGVVTGGSRVSSGRCNPPPRPHASASSPWWLAGRRSGRSARNTHVCRSSWSPGPSAAAPPKEPICTGAHLARSSRAPCTRGGGNTEHTGAACGCSSDASIEPSSPLVQRLPQRSRCAARAPQPACEDFAHSKGSRGGPGPPRVANGQAALGGGAGCLARRPAGASSRLKLVMGERVDV